MMTALERFEANIYRCPMSGCWLWTAHIEANGYAGFRLFGKKVWSHRAAWTLYVGPIPDSLCVLHRCDVRCCVNPSHLFLGTKPDNNADMRAKGRQERGEKHHSAKLTTRDVLLIRADARPQREIARVYGVNETQISKIKLRHLWRHV